MAMIVAVPNFNDIIGPYCLCHSDILQVAKTVSLPNKHLLLPGAPTATLSQSKAFAACFQKLAMLEGPEGDRPPAFRFGGAATQQNRRRLQ